MTTLSVLAYNILPGMTWPFTKSGSTPDHPLLAQSKDYFETLDQSRPLNEYGFVVLDTELTGLNVKKDEIVSIGALRINELRIDMEESFYYCACPTRDVPKQSVVIHGITPSEAQKAPPLKEALQKLLDYCGNAIIVGHNINLDISVINRELKKHFGGALYNPCIDTMRLARVYKEGQWTGAYEFYEEYSYNLRNLSREFGLPLFAEHNAFTDALQTAYLFIYLAHKIQDRTAWTLKDLCKAGCLKRWGL
ncbi:3'-5' exonuclease [Desulfonatronospira sp.]|uniref:3'-5' exonuclease n=1 Tax=Desulfonatronospira sp. TaxID=1962951 RepID=UPI0025C6A442|nr:3'-5' exonuclease [Desulfonatronospira sp.]